MMKFFFGLMLVMTGLNLSAQQHDLQFFVQEALSNSPLLKDYQNQIRAAQIDSLRLRAGFGTQVNGISNNLYAPVVHGWGYDEAITNGANVSAMLSVSREIPGFRNRENQLQAIHILGQSLQNTTIVSGHDLAKTITQQYITAYGSLQQYQFNSEILDLLKKEELVLKRLTQQNIYKQTDYLSFLITLQQQEFQQVKSKSQYRSDLATLNYLCGLQDTMFISLGEPDIALSPLTEAQSSVFYQTFVIDSIKLSTEDKQVDFSYRPKISLFGDAGYNSSLAFQPWKNFGASAGINLSVPIYDGRQRKMQHDKISIAEQTRQNYRDFYLRQYNQQVFQLFEQLQANRQLSDLLKKQSEYSHSLLEASQKLLETGDVLITDYILAINNYLSARNSLVQNAIEKYLLINQINYWSRTK